MRWFFTSLSLLINARLAMASKKPKLIVFDLDYTLWPFWVDTHVSPPFRRVSSGKVIDSHGQEISTYFEVPAVLDKLHKQGYILAVASRTGEIEGALQLIKLFDWDKYFTFKEIFPGRKICHFENFKKQSGIAFADMIFFDDEQRNIKDVRNLGVTSILVKNGVTVDVIKNGLKQYAKEHP